VCHVGSPAVTANVVASAAHARGAYFLCFLAMLSRLWGASRSTCETPARQPCPPFHTRSSLRSSVRCRANLEQISQSKPDSCLGLSHFRPQSLSHHSSCSLPAQQRSLGSTGRQCEKYGESGRALMENQQSCWGCSRGYIRRRINLLLLGNKKSYTTASYK